MRRFLAGLVLALGLHGIAEAQTLTGYDGVWKGRSGEWEIEIRIEGERFTGTARSREVPGGPATVQGKIDGAGKVEGSAFGNRYSNRQLTGTMPQLKLSAQGTGGGADFAMTEDPEQAARRSKTAAVPDNAAKATALACDGDWKVQFHRTVRGGKREDYFGKLTVANGRYSLSAIADIFQMVGDGPISPDCKIDSFVTFQNRTNRYPLQLDLMSGKGKWDSGMAVEARR